MFLTKWVSFIVFTHNPANEYAAGGAQSVAYDAAGNLTLDQRGYTYYYDYENHLTQIKEGSTVKAAYTYDGPGRRAPAEMADDGKVETRYNYIHGNYLEEKKVRMMDRYIANDYLSPKEIIK